MAQGARQRQLRRGVGLVLIKFPFPQSALGAAEVELRGWGRGCGSSLVVIWFFRLVNFYDYKLEVL